MVVGTCHHRRRRSVRASATLWVPFTEKIVRSAQIAQKLGVARLEGSHVSTEELGRGRLEEAMTGSLLPLLDLKLSARAAWSPKCSYGSHVQPISSGPPSHSIRRAAACCACPARCLGWRHERGRKHTSSSRYQRSCLRRRQGHCCNNHHPHHHRRRPHHRLGRPQPTHRPGHTHAYTHALPLSRQLQPPAPI